MKVEDLLLANRGFVENQILTTGQEINLDIPMPKLAIISYQERVYTAVVEPVVEKVLRDDQYEDYYKVLEPGKEGEKQITERIKLVGETEISTEVVKEVILEESIVKKVEIVGNGEDFNFEENESLQKQLEDKNQVSVYEVQDLVEKFLH